MKEIVIAFDCDGTLLKSTDQRTIAPADHIRTLLITLSQFKNTKIVVWSGGGPAYARRVAEALGVTRQTLHRILAKQGAITPEMAVRIGAFIGNGPGLWLRMQQAHDLWHATRKIQGTRVRPIATIKGLSRVGRPRATAQEGAKSRRRARA